MKIDKIIKQISEKDYNVILEMFRSNKSEKFMFLFTSIRNGVDEDTVFNELKISDAAYYTLKSRLIDKIQEHLYLNISDERITLLKNVSNIDRLLYKFPKEVAVALLLKMEEDLVLHDMQNELSLVYNALKKLHINSPKYYTFAQKYNKSVAFNLSIDKAEILVLEFNKVLRNFFLNNADEEKSRLILYKTELKHLSSLYPSHHLSVFSKLVDVQFALYVKDEKAMSDDDTIENNLRSVLEIFQKYKNDKAYPYYNQFVNFLYFEYYSSIKSFKNAQLYFDKIKESFADIVHCDRFFFTSCFFISLLDYFEAKESRKSVFRDWGFFEFSLDEDCFTDNVLHGVFVAYSSFYSQNYSLGIQKLNILLNRFSYKGFKQVEMELKLLLALLYIINGKIELSEGLIRSVSKWISENSGMASEKMYLFVRVLKLTTGSRKKEAKLKKAHELLTEFYHEMGHSLYFLGRIRIEHLHLDRIMD